MSDEKNTRAMHAVSLSQIPRPPKKCIGQFYTIRASDTLAAIAQRFGVTVQQILAANRQIVNPDIIFVGQVICIPADKPVPTPIDLQVLSINFFNQAGQPLPVIGGFVQLAPTTVIRVTFSRPANEVFFFLAPTGTQACEQARLFGVVCANVTTVEFVWQVPAGTSGHVFVIGCAGRVCARSREISVVRP
jgi:murein DD-endopeptidase MepM/ murein hydrolase activator NlpD